MTWRIFGSACQESSAQPARGYRAPGQIGREEDGEEILASSAGWKEKPPRLINAAVRGLASPGTMGSSSRPMPATSDTL